MSNNSWRQYGGIRKHDSFQNLSIGTLVADKVLLREKVSEIVTFTQNLTLTGAGVSFTVESGSIYTPTINVSDKIIVSGDATIGSVLYFGATNINTNYFYKLGEYLGLNTTNPTATFDIVPISSSTENVFTVRSKTTTNRNIIAQNSNTKGIAVTANDTNSYIDFFNTNTNSSSNKPDVRLKSDNTGTFTIDASINTISSRTSTMINSLTTMDISSNGNLKISSNGNVNIIATTGIDLSTNSGFKISAATYFSIVSPTTTIYSKLQLTNRDTSSNIFNETAIIYDISSGTYLYDIYGKSTAYTGTALTMVSNDNSSNTFMKIVSPNKSGLALGGGAYTYDKTRAMATMGLLDTTGTYYPTQTIVKGNSNLKYYSTLGINKYTPTTESYLLDINGATRITNGEINTVLDASFEIKYVAFSKTVPTFGIAVGTPSTISTRWYLYIYYTSDGGLTWTKSEVDADGTSLESTSKNLNIYVYDNTYSIIGTINSFLYFTKNGGANWYKFTGLSGGTQIQNVFIQQTTSNTKKVIFGYNTNTTTTSSTTDYIAYFDLNFANLSNSTYAIIYSSKTPTNTTINYVDGYSTYVYYVGAGIQKYTITDCSLIYSTNTSSTYNFINVYNETTAIAVGTNIISYTTDGTNWTNITSYSYTFKSVYIYNSYYAVAVATSGKFLYTNDGYVTWNIVPDTLLNSGGNSTNINGSTNSLFSVAMTDINTFIISKIIQSYISTSQLGSSKIMCAYLPNLFNRPNNSVLDVSGTMVVSGDVNIKDGGKLYVDYDTSLNGNLFVAYDTSLNSRLVVGSDVTINKRLFIVGDSSLNGNLFVAYDASFNSRLVVRSDVTVNKRLFTVGDTSLNGNLFVAYDTSLNSRLVVGSDVTMNKRLFTVGDTSLNGNLFVAYDTSLNSRLVVGSDVTINKRLFTVGDTSLNGNLFVAYDTSLNSRLVVGGDLTVNNRLIVKSDFSLSGNIKLDGFTTTGNDLSIGGKLSVLYDSSLNSRLVVGSDVTINKRLFTIGDTSLNGNLYVAYDTSLNSRLIVGSDVTINKRLFTVGDTSLNSRLVVGSDITINKRLFTMGDASLNSNLFVAYDTSLNSRLVVGSDVTINKRLFTMGDASLNSNLFVAYDTYLNSRLVVGSDVTINKRLFTMGDASLNGNLFVAYDTSLNSRLVVGSDVTMNKRLFTFGDTSLNGNLFVAYDTSLNSRLVVGSDVTINNRLFSLGDVSFNGSVNIGKDLTINGRLNVQNYTNTNVINTTVNNYQLIVSEDLSLNGRMLVSGDVSLNSNLYVNEFLFVNTTTAINNAIANINGNMIVSYIGIGTTNVNTGRSLDINGNMYQSNGCIFQF